MDKKLPKRKRLARIYRRMFQRSKTLVANVLEKNEILEHIMEGRNGRKH